MKVRRSRFTGARAGILMGVIVACAVAVPAEAARISVYMTRGTELQIVQRKLPLSVDRVAFASRQLFRGPNRVERIRGVRTRIARDMRVYSVVVRNRVAYLRVDPIFLTRGTRVTRRLRIAQVVYTALQFKQVDAVRLLVGSEPLPDPDVVDSKLLDHGSVPAARILPPVPVAVRDVQRRLIALRYLPRGSANGSLNYRTSQALLAFQGWEGLPRTGTVNRPTRIQLVRARVPVPRVRTVARRMEVTRWKGVLLEIRNRRVVRAIHVSTGAGGRTPRGTFRIYRKERNSWSYPFSVWLPWASYFYGGYAFHEYPYVPGFPASHGCIRVGSPEARGVYEFASYGTVVNIV